MATEPDRLFSDLIGALRPKGDRWRGCLMGDFTGNVDAPIDGWKYVRIPIAGTGDYALGMFPSGGAGGTEYNTQVLIEYDPINHQRIIAGADSQAIGTTIGGPTIPDPGGFSLPAHAWTHQLGGNDQLLISREQLGNLQISPSTIAQHVTVSAGVCVIDGVLVKVYLPIDVNLQPFYPATGVKYVWLTLTSAGAVSVIDPAVTDITALTWPSTINHVLGFVMLKALLTIIGWGAIKSVFDMIKSVTSHLPAATAQYQVITSGANPFPATWSTFYLRGTAGGTTNLAVTNTKTLTLTSADDFNLTAERTGAVLVRTATPNIVGDAFGAGNARGLKAVDLQLARLAATQVASGISSVIFGGEENTASGAASTVAGSANTASADFSTVIGGYSGIASGNTSTIVGGVSNVASGIKSTVVGGSVNVAAGEASFAAGTTNGAQADYSFALGRRAHVGGTHAGAFVWGDGTDADFNSITIGEFALRARGGFRHAYDDSNYWQATISAAGAVTFNATGAGAYFTFSDVVRAPQLGLGIAAGTLILNTYANNINESITFQVENTPHAVVISRVDNGNVHLTFNNLTTGYALTDGTDIGIEADGTFRIRQQENLPLEIYTNDTHRWTVLATGHLVSGTAGAGVFNITTAGIITGASLNLSAASNQIVFQSAGTTGTLTWTPVTSNKIVTIPNLTGTVALLEAPNAFTNDNTIASGKFLTALTDGNTGGLRAGSGSDVLWYRGAADTWRTPDSLTVDVGLNVGTASGATAGQIRASAAAMLSGVTTHQYAQQYSGNLADHGKAQLGLAAEENAIIIIRPASADGAIYALFGAFHIAEEWLDVGSHYTTTEDNDGTINIYWDAGNARYEINNEYGSTLSFYIWILRAA
jgi:hypothetical protein